MSEQNSENDTEFGDEFDEYEPEYPARESQYDEREESLADLMAQLGATAQTDALLKLYKKNPRTKKDEFCENYVPEDLPLEETIKEAFGGGEYTVKIYMPTPQGKKSVKGTAKIYIAEPRKSDVHPQNQVTPDQFRESMREMMQTFQTQQMELMKMMLQMQTQKPEQPQMTTADMISALAELDKLRGGNKKDADPMEMLERMFSMHKKTKEFVMEDEPPHDGLGMLMKPVEKLIDLASKQGGQNQQKQNSQTQPREQETPEMITYVIKQHLRELCKRASNGSNPMAYAEVALDQIPERYYGSLWELVSQGADTAVQKMIELHAPVADHAAWFRQFAECIYAALQPDDQDDLTGVDADGIQVGNDSTPPSNPADANADNT